MLTLTAPGQTLDVRIKVDPSPVKSKQIYNIGIQMKRKELTKTFMTISNQKNLWFPWFVPKYSSALRAKVHSHDLTQNF